MNKAILIKLVSELDESDKLFLNQIYTIIKRHLERRRINVSNQRH